MSVSATNLKIALKLAVAPSPLNTLLENAPRLSEAFWNMPVDCALLGVSGTWWFFLLRSHFNNSK